MYLQHYVNEQQDNWIQLLSIIQFVYNSILNKIMKKTLVRVNTDVVHVTKHAKQELI